VPFWKHRLRIGMASDRYQEANADALEVQVAEISWGTDRCIARPSGRFVADMDDEHVVSSCTLIVNFEGRRVESQIAECFVRSLGLTGVSKLFVRSLVGERLPERADYFLGGQPREDRAVYASRLPNSLTPVDRLFLSILYDDRLKPGALRDDVRPIVRRILEESSLILTELEEYRA